MSWQIKCDFDGTVTNLDCTDLILSKFADPAWEEIETLWQSGQIGSLECLARQSELINATPEDITNLLSSVAIDDYFVEFVNFCRTSNLPLNILSDGYDFSINNILKRLGIDNLKVIANNLQYCGNSKFKLAFPYSNPNCLSQSGNCKCSQADKSFSTILIGDGKSDFCLAKRADIVIAKSSLLKFCQDQNIDHFAFQNFNDVKNIIANLVAKGQKDTELNKNYHQLQL